MPNSMEKIADNSNTKKKKMIHIFHLSFRNRFNGFCWPYHCVHITLLSFGCCCLCMFSTFRGDETSSESTIEQKKCPYSLRFWEVDRSIIDPPVKIMTQIFSRSLWMMIYYMLSLFIEKFCAFIIWTQTLFPNAIAVNCSEPSSENRKNVYRNSSIWSSILCWRSFQFH